MWYSYEFFKEQDIELQHLNDTLLAIEKCQHSVLSISRLYYEQKDFEERKIWLS